MIFYENKLINKKINLEQKSSFVAIANCLVTQKAPAICVLALLALKLQLTVLLGNASCIHSFRKLFHY